MTSYRYDSAEAEAYRLVRKAAADGDRHARWLVDQDRKEVLRAAIEEDYREAMDLGLMDAAASLKLARHWV